MTDVEIVNGELIVTVYDPATDTSTPENLGNVEGADGEDGKSITDVSTADALDPITNEVNVTEVTCWEGDNNPVGRPVTVLNGVDGEDGLSAYESWEQLPGNDNKSEKAFIDSLKGEDGQDGQDGRDGKSTTDVEIVDGELFVTVYDPATDTSTPENLGNVEGADGEDGKSITDVSTADALEPFTKDLIGTEITFLDEDNYPFGSAVSVLIGVGGENGEVGLSAYEIWEQLPGNDGKSEQDFIDSLKGEDGQDGQDGLDGKSITDVEIVDGELIVTVYDPATDTSTPENLGNVEGADGEDGKSITDVSTADALDPITNEVIGTEITFLDEDNTPVGAPVTVLNGVDGEDGLSAYEIWEQLPGNDGKSEQDFIDSLKGEDGQDGQDGLDGKSITDVEIVDGELIVTVYDPATDTSTPENLGNVEGADGEDCKSITDVSTADALDPITNEVIGTEITFLDEDYPPRRTSDPVLNGVDGEDGLSAYEIWEQLPGNDGKSEQDFIDSLKGEDGQDGLDGKSITEVKIVDGELIVTVYDPETDTSTPENLGNVEGADGEDGKSIADVSTADALDPIANEVIGTEITFLDEDNNPVGSPVTVLNGVDGENGEDGLSAYEIWEQLPGNDGKSEQDF